MSYILTATNASIHNNVALYCTENNIKFQYYKDNFNSTFLATVLTDEEAVLLKIHHPKCPISPFNAKNLTVYSEYKLGLFVAEVMKVFNQLNLSLSSTDDLTDEELFLVKNSST